MAAILVTDRDFVGGVPRTTVLVYEYAKDGATLLPAERFVLAGDVVRVDALAIRFDGKFVEQREELRGHGVLLLTNISGDKPGPPATLPATAPATAPTTSLSS